MQENRLKKFWEKHGWKFGVVGAPGSIISFYQFITTVLPFVGSGFLVRWAAMQPSAPDLNSVEWLAVYLVVAAVLLAILIGGGLGVGLAVAKVRAAWPRGSTDLKFRKASLIELAREQAAEKAALARTAVATAAPAPKPSKPPVRIYTDYEKSKKLPVIDAFRDLLEGPMQATIDDGPRIRGNWWNALKDPKNHPNYLSDLIAYRDNIDRSREMFDHLRDVHRRHDDIISHIQATYWNTVPPKVGKFHVAYQVAQNAMKPDAPREALELLMNDPEKNFEEAIVEFASWRNKTLGTLQDIERRINAQAT